MTKDLDESDIKDERLIQIFGLIILISNILISFKSVPTLLKLLDDLHKPPHQNDMVGAGPVAFFFVLFLSIHSTLPCAVLGVFYNEWTSRNSGYLSICAMIIVLITLAPILILITAFYISSRSSFALNTTSLAITAAIFGLTFILVEKNKESTRRRVEKTLLHYNSFGLIVLALLFLIVLFF